MPIMEVFFEVYCAVCKTGICSNTSVEGRNIYVKCHNCIKESKELEEKIETLQDFVKHLMKQSSIYPTIPELNRLEKLGITI
jgi:hypothetical protein